MSSLTDEDDAALPRERETVSVAGAAMNAEPVVHDSDYWQLTRTSDGSVLMRRTPDPFPTIEVAIAEFTEIVRVLRTDTMFSGGLVVNGKAVRGRNDDAYEAAVKPYLDQLVLMSRRVGFVMQTAPGALQVRRLSGHLATPIDFFAADDAALAFVAPRAGESRTDWSVRPRRRA